jgi:hypothetical protein
MAMTIDTYILLVDVTAASSDPVPTSSTAALAISVPQEPSPELSPLAQILGELQELQQNNPAEYKQVTAQIASNLQAAAQTAQTDQNSTAASQLNQLATDFTNALQTGQLPDIQDLAQGLSGASGQTQSQLAPSAYENNAQSDSLSPSAIILNALSSTEPSAQTLD